jgi:hypothetical protein
MLRTPEFSWRIKDLSCRRSVLQRVSIQTSSTETEKKIDISVSEYDGTQFEEDDVWIGNMDGFDWQLERARRVLEGPAFAPFRMTLWQPDTRSKMKSRKPSIVDSLSILLNNALQALGVAESYDGAPVAQVVNTFKGSIFKLISRIADGNLAEIAGKPLFLLLRDYYEKYGSVFKLAFGPKSFIVVSDPIMARHILKENPFDYDKGILAEILEPVMGKVRVFAESSQIILLLFFFINEGSHPCRSRDMEST